MRSTPAKTRLDISSIKAKRAEAWLPMAAPRITGQDAIKFSGALGRRDPHFRVNRMSFSFFFFAQQICFKTTFFDERNGGRATRTKNLRHGGRSDFLSLRKVIFAQKVCRFYFLILVIYFFFYNLPLLGMISARARKFPSPSPIFELFSGCTSKNTTYVLREFLLEKYDICFARASW